MVSIHSKVIYRIPLFPINAKLEDCWPALKMAIKSSSPDFYLQVQDVEIPNLPSLPRKVFHTIWKYFNRAKFRPTPYGSFAAVGLFEFDIKNEKKLTISNHQKLHEFIDWSQVKNIGFDFQKMVLDDVFIQVNHTYYLISGAIRFISKNDEGFSLEELETEPEILDILEKCGTAIHISKLIKSIGEPFEALIEHLISIQLLISSYSANIIGEDFFKRVNATHIDNTTANYVIAEWPYIEGAIDKKIFKHLPELVDRLNEINPISNNANLSSFINRFSKKFEQQEIPLMNALDPEFGIGYDDLEISAYEDPFLQELGMLNDNQGTTNHQLSDYLTECLFNQINADTIDLANYDGKQRVKSKLPNTMSALCSIAGDKLIIDSLGGSNANALIGRFSHMNNEMHSFCKELATIEEKSNKEVLFFDIGYQGEGRVDNINRRRAIYNHQISICDYNTSSEPIILNDILLSVKNGELILRSQSLKKRMIPRLASAYNYGRSDLSLFRLLCDVQNQHINSNLSFSIQSLIPNLNYYPGVAFKNIVISTRKWKVEYKNVADKINEVLAAGCRRVKVGHGDQTLCFDLKSSLDKEILFVILKKGMYIYLEECLMDKNNTVTNLQDNAYKNQFVISLYHHDEIYEGTPTAFPFPLLDVQRIFTPGSEWLYVQVFIHPLRADEILLNHISPFIESYKECIECFFFIRYNEDGHHLRLRFKVKDRKIIGNLLVALNNKLEHLVLGGIISEIKIGTYVREGHRYGWHQIPAIEAFFHLDSASTLTLLSTTSSSDLKYIYTLELIRAIQQAQLFQEEEFLQLLLKVCESFNGEHQFGVMAFKKINERFKMFSNEMQIMQGHHIFFPLKTIVPVFISLLNDCPQSLRPKLFLDLLHMHINRLFASKQRLHEAIVYNMAAKILLKEKAIKKSSFKRIA